MNRQKYQKRLIRLVSESQKDQALREIRMLPCDSLNPICITISEESKPRTLDQNALMWAGPLKDISGQAWVQGRQFSPEIWHEYFKKMFLPEEYNEEECKEESYRKWDFGIDGQPILIGSTTKLTKKGFANYLEQVHAFGANLGVKFTEGREF